ncbi:MAG: hypothetical protein NWE95_11145 [Candidatus Bathyarchaeota archaeon]|nr:hypothetical protein [Candidatus Bathyarchaeota archaeon]
MMEENENVEVSGIESKFTRIVLTIVAVFLIFVGPTYIPFLLANVIGMEYFASIGVGLVLFILGLVVLFFLIRKKVVT